ncbi:LOW QUALITY PROTEIN: suppressor APC domain-containing protein 2 [Rhinatrema bivittatum]|uniref:LOW QUALITY PROTEIN: suppressor APC domain-containing protein 2 n=1 Tax=Rhinatrema bivittatum TaxID=194408 RepID=UPI001128B589|nr:LOW QUALITY PROTEIN: suppressor APC domain-containing protein 2 [Rhinatrema bivittatum]
MQINADVTKEARHSKEGAAFCCLKHWGLLERESLERCVASFGILHPQRSMAVIGSGRGCLLPVELHSSTQGLPKAFLLSLRTLFDILDDHQRGYVHIQEIESRWQGTDTRELPKGVLECLRKVAPANGYLTFERFVLGLRRSILNPEIGDKIPCGHGGTKENGRSIAVGPSCRHAGSCQVRAKVGQKPLTIYSSAEEHNIFLEKKPLGVRYMNGTSENSARSLEKIPSSQELKTGPYRVEPDRNGLQHPGQAHLDPTQRGQSGGRPGGRLQSKSTSAETAGPPAAPQNRGEHRRHTITNGVDYSMLKQMKELEQEKDFLIQGLEMLERARDWYHQQIQAVQEHQKHLGKNQPQKDLSSEGSQGHLSYLLPKLQEVHRYLNDLISSSSKPLKSSSSATNGFVPVVGGRQQAITMLKEQNRLLTKEVTDKSDRITQLEQEKSALIKQLFEARARSNQESSQLDSTFI